MEYSLQILLKKRAEINTICNSIPAWSTDYKVLQNKMQDIDFAVNAIEQGQRISSKQRLSKNRNIMKYHVQSVRVFRAGEWIYKKEYNKEMTDEEMDIIQHDLSILFVVPMSAIGFIKSETETQEQKNKRKYGML